MTPAIQDALDRIWSDAALKSRLLAEPNSVLAEFGLTIPASVTVQIHENTPTLMNAVLPLQPANGGGSADPISRLMERAWTDAEFKAKLLSDSKEAAAEMGIKLPESMILKVWENSATEEHMVLPTNPAESELSDADLVAVAGGMSKSEQVQIGCGVGAGAAALGGGLFAFTAVGAAIGIGASVATGISSAVAVPVMQDQGK